MNSLIRFVLFLIMVGTIWCTAYGIDTLDPPYSWAALVTGSIVGLLTFYGLCAVHDPYTYPDWVEAADPIEDLDLNDNVFGGKDQYPDEEVVEIRRGPKSTRCHYSGTIDDDNRSNV